MDSCQYKEITNHEKIRQDNMKSILKQIIIVSTSWCQVFMAGLCVGAPTVFIPQMRKEVNSTFIIDDEMGSWLYSTSGFAMYPWIIVLPLLTKHWGRKKLQIATAICSTVVFVILYLSRNPYHILISAVLQGFVFAGNITFRVLIVTDYVSLEYRGVFLAIKTASFFWGIWFSNAIGTYFYWKNIAIFGFVCSLHPYIFIFCPESPVWLARKGRIEECKAAYRWIFGSNDVSEKKLHQLLASCSKRNKEASFCEMLKSKQFYKPAAICVITIIQYHFSGKVMCSIYILDIFKNITNDKATAYAAMLILDGITVLGTYFGSYLSKVCKRRTLYMSCSFTGIILLFIISIYLYLVKISVIPENKYISLVLLMAYSLSISCGPLVLSLSIYGEVIPLKFQATCYMITGLTFAIAYSILIKLSPTIFKAFGMHGTFLFYCITCGICTVYLFLYMPETKNKTFEEIESFFKGKEDKIEEQEPLKLT